jgi:hypothetical protein
MNTSAGVKASDVRLQLRPAQRLLMLAVNYLPLMHALAVVAVVGFGWGPLPWRIIAGVALLYVAPALAARILGALAPLPEGRIGVGTRSFFVWWALLNLQTLFSRLPVLEESIRLVPGCYSAWLRLWGARIGRLTYWGAGVQILDRSLLEVGNDVVLAAGTRLSAHIVARNEKGEMELSLGRIVIGDRCVVGGYSLLSAGTELAAGECTPGALVSPPFSRWENGERISKTGAPP